MFKTKNTNIYDLADGIFLCRLIAYISKDIGLFNSRSCYLQIVVNSVLGRTIGVE